MEADKDRLDSKLRGAVVVDISAARNARDNAASVTTPFTAGYGWLYLVAAFIIGLYFAKR